MRHESLTRDLLILAACVVATGAIDWLDYLSGEEYDLFVFYFIPIAAAAWYAGMWPAVFVAFVSAGAWFEADLLSAARYSFAVGSWDTAMRLTSFLALGLALSRIRGELAREKKLNADLSEAMAEIKQLRGILPMCSFCRKIRDASQEWVPLEKYIADHSDAKVSHGLCPACYRKHYGKPDGT